MKVGGTPLVRGPSNGLSGASVCSDKHGRELWTCATYRPFPSFMLLSAGDGVCSRNVLDIPIGISDQLDGPQAAYGQLLVKLRETCARL